MTCQRELNSHRRAGETRIRHDLFDLRAMPLEMRACYEQPLIAIQFAEDRMGKEVPSQTGVRRRGKIYRAPTSSFELSKQLIVIPLAGWLDKLRCLITRIALYNNCH